MACIRSTLKTVSMWGQVMTVKVSSRSHLKVRKNLGRGACWVPGPPTSSGRWGAVSLEAWASGTLQPRPTVVFRKEPGAEGPDSALPRPAAPGLLGTLFSPSLKLDDPVAIRLASTTITPNLPQRSSTSRWGVIAIVLRALELGATHRLGSQGHGPGPRPPCAGDTSRPSLHVLRAQADPLHVLGAQAPAPTKLQDRHGPCITCISFWSSVHC